MLKKVTSIILAGILSLAEYKTKLPELDVCRTCANCGRARALHRHGYYPRKSDRNTNPGQSLNPVKILRFICKFCRKTCSPLPECIPPRRWYLWNIQQEVIQEYLDGKSLSAISETCGLVRSTCRRWIKSLQDKFLLHADCLRNLPGDIGREFGHCFDVRSLWQKCLSKINLSRAMFLCNQSGMAVP